MGDIAAPCLPVAWIAPSSGRSLGGTTDVGPRNLLTRFLRGVLLYLVQMQTVLQNWTTVALRVRGIRVPLLLTNVTTMRRFCMSGTATLLVIRTFFRMCVNDSM